MTFGSKIAWSDSVLPFQLDHSDIRGRVARLDGVLNDVLRQHNYPPAVEAMVAEAALLTALIGQTIKLRWKLSLQIRGKGPLRFIATDYYGPQTEGEEARIRAYASFDAEALETDGDPFAQIGEGYFALLLDQGTDMVPYQGMTSLEGGSLAKCAEAYFAQSEQIPTRFALSCGKGYERGRPQSWLAGGMMVQHMPKAGMGASSQNDLSVGGNTSEDASQEDWTRVNILLDTVEDSELVGPQLSPADLLVRLFHEEGPRVFEAQPVRFGCSCSADKVRQTLSIYSQADLAHMTTKEGQVTADCQFCGAHYALDPATLGIDAVDVKDKDG